MSLREMAEYTLYVASGQEIKQYPHSFLVGLRYGMFWGHFLCMPPLIAFLLIHYIFLWP